LLLTPARNKYLWINQVLKKKMIGKREVIYLPSSILIRPPSIKHLPYFFKVRLQRSQDIRESFTWEITFYLQQGVCLGWENKLSQVWWLLSVPFAS
jgi:hypothetical protein